MNRAGLSRRTALTGRSCRRLLTHNIVSRRSVCLIVTRLPLYLALAPQQMGHHPRLPKLLCVVVRVLRHPSQAYFAVFPLAIPRPRLGEYPRLASRLHVRRERRRLLDEKDHPVLLGDLSECFHAAPPAAFAPASSSLATTLSYSALPT